MSSENPLVTVMRESGGPMTREEFLRFRYGGNVPAVLSAEEEADIPEEFQLPQEGKTASAEDGYDQSIWQGDDNEEYVPPTKAEKVETRSKLLKP